MANSGTAQLHKLAYGFIAKNRTASLATVDKKGRPHIALVFCITYDNLPIYFTTRAEGRKFDNLVSQPVVSMAFNANNSLQQLQLNGVVERVQNQKQALDVLHALWKLRYENPDLPPLPTRMVEPGLRKELAVFRVTPTEMTFADFETNATGRYKPEFKKII